MGPCPAVSWFTRKAKFLLLLALCLCVLAWIATLTNGPVKTTEQEPTLPQVQNEGKKDAELKLEEGPERSSAIRNQLDSPAEEEEGQEEQGTEDKATKASCPDESPLLRECYRRHF